jgi:hypothetical protein
LELKKLALSCDASLLHDVPDDLGKIAGKLMRYWWMKHGLPYCMQKVEEENWVSFTTIHFAGRVQFDFADNSSLCAAGS